MNTTIKAVAAGDLELFQQLQVSCFLDPLKIPIFQSVGQIESEDHFNLFLFKVDEAPVGGCKLYFDHNGCKIDLLFMLPEYRRFGLASRFLLALESRFCEVRRWHIVVEKSNEPALKFLLKNGYKIIGTKTNQLILDKKITP
ncbi:MAG: GNAT family N-acetyltransferase [Lactobacillales bacterium]|jgi:GNAT superfamily N-acetyltransferase|nr:GNAT family N-acetyltransferase [Lactobacillales bacterium]